MKSYNLETINCPLCNSSDYNIYIENAKELYNNMDEFFNVCYCLECSHYFTNPRPTMDTIKYFYPDDAGYYAPVPYSLPRGKQYEIYIKILNEKYGYNLNSGVIFILARLVFLIKKRNLETSHIPYFIKGGRLLDIGCSYGTYLKKMENLSWKVYGTEINEKAVKYAQKELGLKNINNDFFENSNFEKEFFDVVNMNMVLEHIYEPKSILTKVSSILKKDGQLMISVPDISGFESKFYKQYAYGLQVPEHLHHFTPKTISFLLESCGFKVEKIVHQNFDRDLVASAGYRPNKTLSKILSTPLIRNTVVKVFILFLAMIGKTSRMSIYARKM